ncbi:Fic family protein [Eggerthella sinensis]|uniref:Fic family protein n=1 Tax=Eggerthella sinensis TaxID=242230 RepID=A0A3N0IX82_9ACTN|nr:Fic family protein [Eggerthella sinensis]RDB68498.1 Fic family protein [Eggerthella sinensis]RNM41545.1 Fic family protein [Eggerthella sinensis]
MDVAAFMHDNRDYFEDFITRSTYHSNAIEGSTLSYAETYAILWNDNSLRVTATARELYEAINHKYALDVALGNLEDPLSERLIEDVAQAINKNINEIGGYRTVSVLIRGAEHIPPRPNQINQLMMQLVYERNHDDAVDPFDREARFHIRFERIHPFEDGNGRTGRILVNRGLVKEGLAPVVVPFELRAAYLELLAQGDAEGLAAMFRDLSAKEEERIVRFAEAARG